MKHLVIIGAGGFGREIFCSARESIGYGEEFDIKGFLDDNMLALEGYNGYPSILGTVNDYTPETDDVFACAVGVVKTRKELSEIIIEKGGKFINLIHKTAYLSMNVKIGEGCLILADTRVHCDVTIGNHVILQPKAIIGHDVTIGDWTLINAFADCGGMSKIGNEVTMHTTSFCLPLSKIEDGATVGAGSVVLRKVKAGQTVIGVPAKPIALPKVNK